MFEQVKVLLMEFTIPEYFLLARVTNNISLSVIFIIYIFAIYSIFFFYIESTVNFARPSLLRSQGFALVCFRFRISTSSTHRGPVDQLRLPNEKIFPPRRRAKRRRARVVVSPYPSALLSLLALRHWRATLIIRYRSGEQTARGQGEASKRGGLETKRVARCSANISR